MPIKEIITLGLMSIAVIAFKGGPIHLRENLLKTQVQILREVGTTSNWGDPLIWHSRGLKKSAKRAHLVTHKP